MRAVIFDFDGVIVDSEPVHEEGLRLAAATVGMAVTHERYLAEYVGYDDRDCFVAVARDHGRELTEEECEALAQRKAALVAKMLDEGRAPAYPGAVELVKAAGAEYPIAICSGALLSEIEACVKRLGIRELFRTIVSAEMVEKSKPDPACYLLTAERLGVAPAECVVIEDTPTGATAAKRAGMKVMGVGHTVGVEKLRGVADGYAAQIKNIQVSDLISMI